MAKKLFIMLVCLVATCAALAEDGPQATFKESSHDFGNIQEAKGPVSYTFEFTNTGDKPLIIVDAVASCGCTKPEYSGKPIKPGKKGKIKVTYSPYGRPGAFRKTIKVKTNAAEKRATLTITGVVIPKTK
ncbi:MAG: DUF1573 domain-containing protein [Muribaculaceae bacterium]|nr:DUF1573 domain-containing protein [Muribaculaceae bacterium]